MFQAFSSTSIAVDASKWVQGTVCFTIVLFLQLFCESQVNNRSTLDDGMHTIYGIYGCVANKTISNCLVLSTFIKVKPCLSFRCFVKLFVRLFIKQLTSIILSIQWINYSTKDERRQCIKYSYTHVCNKNKNSLFYIPISNVTHVTKLQSSFTLTMVNN